MFLIFFHCLTSGNDLANVSASACLVGRLCSILRVLAFSPARYLPVAFSLLGLCVLCVIQPLPLVWEIWVVWLTSGVVCCCGDADIAAPTVCSLAHKTVSSHKRLFPLLTTWESWSCLCLNRFGYRDLEVNETLVSQSYKVLGLGIEEKHIWKAVLC